MEETTVVSTHMNITQAMVYINLQDCIHKDPLVSVRAVPEYPSVFGGCF